MVELGFWQFWVSGVSTKQKCFERHPKKCIYFEKGECQWGSRCKYLHQANNDTNDKDPDESIEESLESTLAEDVHDDTLDYEVEECDNESDHETIGSIMAKARAFEGTDESES